MNSPGHNSTCRCSACAGEHGSNRRPLLSLLDLTFRRENRVVLNDVNFTVDYGDFIAITGPNGGGKTTLLRLILGLLKPTQGKICYFAPDGSRLQSRPAFGYLPQKNSVDSHFPITVEEVVSSGLLAHKELSEAEKAERVRQTLECIGLPEYASNPIGNLSGGQLQRVLFGRAIVSRPPVLVLDEPLSYIDKNFEKQLYSIVSELSKHTTIMLVSHEMSEIAGMANRHIIVDRTLHECTARHHYIRQEC